MAGVAAVATIFGVGAQLHGQYQASQRADDQADQEKEMARQEAAAIEAETAENVRRARDKASRVESTSRARAAASGLEVDGSLGIALDSMSEEHNRQIAWMAKAGASNARMAIKGGGMRADAQTARSSALQAQMWGTAAQGAGSTYSYGKDAGWWAA